MVVNLKMMHFNLRILEITEMHTWKSRNFLLVSEQEAGTMQRAASPACLPGLRPSICAVQYSSGSLFRLLKLWARRCCSLASPFAFLHARSRTQTAAQRLWEGQEGWNQRREALRGVVMVRVFLCFAEDVCVRGKNDLSILFARLLSKLSGLPSASYAFLSIGR